MHKRCYCTHISDSRHIRVFISYSTSSTKDDSTFERLMPYCLQGKESIRRRLISAYICKTWNNIFKLDVKRFVNVHRTQRTARKTFRIQSHYFVRQIAERDEIPVEKYKAVHAGLLLVTAFHKSNFEMGLLLTLKEQKLHGRKCTLPR